MVSNVVCNFVRNKCKFVHNRKKLGRLGHLGRYVGRGFVENPGKDAYSLITLYLTLCRAV